MQVQGITKAKSFKIYQTKGLCECVLSVVCWFCLYLVLRTYFLLGKKFFSGTGWYSTNIGQYSSNIGQPSSYIGEYSSNIGCWCHLCFVLGPYQWSFKEFSSNIGQYSSNTGCWYFVLGPYQWAFDECSSNIGDWRYPFSVFEPYYWSFPLGQGVWDFLAESRNQTHQPI